MKLFRPRQTIIENLTLLALMAALDGVIALICFFLPFSVFGLLLLLPLISAVAVYFCKKRFAPIYLISALFVSSLCSGFDFVTTFIYVLPSLLTGTAYGLLKRIQIDEIVSLFLLSLLQAALFLASNWILKIALDVSVEGDFLKLLGADDSFGHALYPALIFGYSIGQITITGLFIRIVTHSFGMENASEKTWMYPLFCLLSLLFGIPGCFVNEIAFLSYLAIAVSFFWGVASFKRILNKPRVLTWVILGAGEAVAALLVLALFSYFGSATNVFPLFLYPLYLPILFASLIKKPC